MTGQRPSLPTLHAAWLLARDVLLFTGGLGLTIHEAVAYEGPTRWGLLAVYTGMMGLPPILRRDERRTRSAESPVEVEL